MRSVGDRVPSVSEDPPRSWYAVYTRHQHEKNAADLLARKDFEVFLPVYSSTRRWKDRKKNILLPLFPGYVFIRTNLSRKTEILTTPSVLWMVESGKQAAAIPDAEIEAVRRLTANPERVEPHPFLKVGQRVRIHVGPLAGIEGILTRVKSRYRVVLSLELLQKAVAVEVDFSSVEIYKAAGAS
jgi:transcription antitermination factor NusG